MPAVGDVLAARYRIDALLGVGGMATVWRARDLRLDRDVALKVLLPNLAADPALAARFDREARALAALSDPHVVGIHDVVGGEADAEPFLVMELCPGGSLGDRLAGGAALPAPVALPILADAATGLAALHAAGIVHRDVTARNVLLAGGRAKLADLGIARAGAAGETVGAGLTPPGTALGTLASLSPEVIAGRPATAASDVYGLGAVAYRTLAGALPRPAASLAELAAARGRAVPPLAERAPGIPPAVAAAVDRALDPDPGRRPTAMEMATAFGAAAPATGPGADERTVLAPPAPPTTHPAVTARPTSAGARPSPGAPSPEAPAGGERRNAGGGRPLPAPGPGYRGPSLWSGELVAVVVVAAVIVLVVLLAMGGHLG
ncbi:MAG: serine/threonine-protein kinase [Chloroflexi bacterium]|nr:serine/threonine-protein kinase [Chloroflexota bacterium]